MANRRMFSKDVTETDNFMMMKPITQALYFHLGIVADDDGFSNNFRMIMRMIGANEESLKELKNNGYIYHFEDSGAVVLRDFNVSNSIRKDRYTPTIFQEEFSRLTIIGGKYHFTENIEKYTPQPKDNQLATKGQPVVGIGKDSIVKSSIGKSSIGKSSVDKNSVDKNNDNNNNNTNTNINNNNNINNTNTNINTNTNNTISEEDIFKEREELAITAWNSVRDLDNLKDEEVYRIGQLINVFGYDDVIQVIANIASSERLLKFNGGKPIKLLDIDKQTFKDISAGLYN